MSIVFVCWVSLKMSNQTVKQIEHIYTIDKKIQKKTTKNDKKTTTTKTIYCKHKPNTQSPYAIKSYKYIDSIQYLHRERNTNLMENEEKEKNEKKFEKKFKKKICEKNQQKNLKKKNQEQKNRKIQLKLNVK